MDAFAVAVCLGLTMPRATIQKLIVVGLYFGFFQTIMPLIGYLAATQFADKVILYDHLIAFALLCFLGGKMIIESQKKESYHDRKCEASLKPTQMLPLAVATSIDALAVGVSFAFLRVNIVPAVSFIGIITFAVSVMGVKIGHVFGRALKSKAEFAGGMILVLIAFKILFEHL